ARAEARLPGFLCRFINGNVFAVGLSRGTGRTTIDAGRFYRIPKLAVPSGVLFQNSPPPGLVCGRLRILSFSFWLCRHSHAPNISLLIASKTLVLAFKFLSPLSTD